MRAIRVEKGGKMRGLFLVHALLDPERTMCGRKPKELDVIERLEIEKLPARDGCRSCLRVLEHWTQPEREKIGLSRYTHGREAPGRVRKTGPLNHGLRSKGGRLR